MCEVNVNLPSLLYTWGPRQDLNHEVCALDVITILYLGQNNLIVRIPDLHMHTDLGTGGGEPVGPRVVQLHLVVT